jgi:transposase
MEVVKVIGSDIAKSAFQVHRINAEGKVIIRRQFKRRHVLPFFQKQPPRLVGLDYWGRRISDDGAEIGSCVGR